MDFWEVVGTRRSVRSYSSDPVPTEMIERVLEGARIAPSANNVQPWRFIVIRDASVKSEVADLAAGQQFIAEAPVVIVCCVQRYHDRYSWLADDMCLVDGSIAFTHLLLAARAEGLGTCWIGAFDHDELKRLLGVPDEYVILALAPLGYPAGEGVFRTTVDRRSFQDIVFLERFGEQIG